jgi:hypothetical protein
LQRIVDHPGFTAGNYNTHLLDDLLPAPQSKAVERASS